MHDWSPKQQAPMSIVPHGGFTSMHKVSGVNRRAGGGHAPMSMPSLHVPVKSSQHAPVTIRQPENWQMVPG